MKLQCTDIEKMYLEHTSEVSSADIKMINEKTQSKKLIIDNIVLLAVFVIGLILSLIYSHKTIFPCLVFVLIMVYVLYDDLKKRNVTACYAVVIEKKERWAAENAKKTPHTIPYEKTDSVGSSNRKQHLFYNIRSYYFCTVEINGVIYENVCCFDKDYDRINVGDTVVIGGNTSLPIIYERTASEKDS